MDKNLDRKRKNLMPVDGLEPGANGVCAPHLEALHVKKLNYFVKAVLRVTQVGDMRARRDGTAAATMLR